MKKTAFDRQQSLISAAIVVVPVVWLIVVGTMVYVAWHFVAKYW